jgi:hypothetical protein
VSQRVIVTLGDSDQSGVIPVDGPDGDTLLMTFAGAEVTFDGVNNRTECERCTDDLESGEPTDLRLLGMVGAGTLNQTYFITRNDPEDSDGTQTSCEAYADVNGPTYYLSLCDDCPCLLVTRFFTEGAEEIVVPAHNAGRVTVTVRIEPSAQPPRIVITAHTLVAFVSDFGAITFNHVYFFYGTAELCGMSYPTFTVSNQINPGDVCFDPSVLDLLADTGSTADQTFYIAGSGGGTATVTLACTGLGVSQGEADEFDLASCGDNCSDDGSSDDDSGSSDTGSDSDTGSTGESGSSGDTGSGSGSGSSGSLDPDGSDGDGESGSDPCEGEGQNFACVALWHINYDCESAVWESDGPQWDGVDCLDLCFLDFVSFDAWNLQLGACCPDGATANWYHVVSDTCPGPDPINDHQCPPDEPTGGGPEGNPVGLTPPMCEGALWEFFGGWGGE